MLSLQLYITLCVNLSIIEPVDSRCVLGKRYSELYPLISNRITKMNHDSQPTPRSSLCQYFL